MLFLVVVFVVCLGVCVRSAVVCSLVMLCCVSALVSCCISFVYVLLLLIWMSLFSILSSYLICSYLYWDVVPYSSVKSLSRSFSLCIVLLLSCSCCGICACMLLWLVSMRLIYCVIVSSWCIVVVIWFLMAWRNVVSVMVPVRDDTMLGIIVDGCFMFIDGMFLRSDVVIDSVIICVPVAISFMLFSWLVGGEPMCGFRNMSWTPALVRTMVRSSSQMLRLVASVSLSDSHRAFVL